MRYIPTNVRLRSSARITARRGLRPDADLPGLTNAPSTVDLTGTVRIALFVTRIGVRQGEGLRMRGGFIVIGWDVGQPRVVVEDVRIRGEHGIGHADQVEAFINQLIHVGERDV